MSRPSVTRARDRFSPIGANEDSRDAVMVQVFAWFAAVGVVTVVAVTGAVVLGVLAVAAWADEADTGDYQLT